MLFSGCATALDKKNSALANGIYLEHNAIVHGRYDLAKKYDSELVKLVAPPKKQIEIKAIQVTDKTTGTKKDIVVLPQEDAGKQTVAIDTPDFAVVEQQNPDVIKQVAQDDKNVEKFSGQVADAQRAIEKASEKKTSIFGHLFSFIGAFGLFGGLGLIVVIIGLCIVEPQLIPSVVAGAIHFLINIFSGIAKGISSIFKKGG